MNLWQQHARRFMPFRQARAFLENTRNLERAARTRTRGLCSSAAYSSPSPAMRAARSVGKRIDGPSTSARQARMDAGLCVRCGKPRERKAVGHCHACIALTTGSRVRRSKARHAKAGKTTKATPPVTASPKRPDADHSGGQDASVLK